MCLYFKCSLIFRAHALQWEHNKFGYTNFVKLGLQSMSPKIERAFEKRTKYVFNFFLPTLNLTSFFLHFLIDIFSSSTILYPYSSLNLCDEYHF